MIKDVVGWLAVALSFLGQALAAYGDRRGWAMRLVSQPLWIAFAVMKDTTCARKLA